MTILVLSVPERDSAMEGPWLAPTPGSTSHLAATAAVNARPADPTAAIPDGAIPCRMLESSFPASLSSLPSLRWMDGLALRSIPADSGTRAPALTDQPLHRCRGSAVNRLRRSQPSPRNTRVRMLALPSEEGVIDGVSAEIQAPWGFAQGRLGRRCRRGIFSHVIHSYLQPD